MKDLSLKAAIPPTLKPIAANFVVAIACCGVKPTAIRKGTIIIPPPPPDIPEKMPDKKTTINTAKTCKTLMSINKIVAGYDY